MGFRVKGTPSDCLNVVYIRLDDRETFVSEGELRRPPYHGHHVVAGVQCLLGQQPAGSAVRPEDCDLHDRIPCCLAR